MTIAAIVVGGQTGVDQGAASGAFDVGIKVEGYRPSPQREQTEAGPVPDWLYRHLKPVERGGYKERTLMNLAAADALLVLVPNRQRWCESPGTNMTVEYALARSMQITLADGSDILFVSQWLARVQLLYGRPIKLMVAGPRESIWPAGFSVAHSFIASLFGRQLVLPGIE